MVTMLIDQITAAGIADGSITLVLRRWDAPRAKEGGTQRTPAGTIRVERQGIPRHVAMTGILGAGWRSSAGLALCSQK
jgi:hypothetical protein